MKTSFILPVILLLSCLVHQVSAQRQGEILVQQKGLGFAYYLEGRQISKNELLHVLDSHPDSNKELKIGHRNKMPAAIMRYAGGILLSYMVGTQIAGGTPNWTIAGIGAGLQVLSLPFSGAAMKREQKAVHRYNTGFRQASIQRPDLQLDNSLTKATAGITY